MLKEQVILVKLYQKMIISIIFHLSGRSLY